jgi:hypothetical protein
MQCLELSVGTKCVIDHYNNKTILSAAVPTKNNSGSSIDKPTKQQQECIFPMAAKVTLNGY